MVGNLCFSDLDSFVQLRERSVRDKFGLFLSEGIRNLMTAGETQKEILAIVVCPQLLTNGAARLLIKKHQKKGAKVISTSQEEFQKLSMLDNPRGIALVTRQLWTTLPSIKSLRSGLWLCLETVQSPGNLGSTIRTCQAVGAQGIIFLGPEVDPFDPRVVRPTMGAIFHQKLVRTHIGNFKKWKNRCGVDVVGTSSHVRQDFRSHRYDGPTVLMMGNERKGLSEDQRQLCDRFVRIPMRGGIDSLNLAVASSVLLYEIYGQRNPVPRPKKPPYQFRKSRRPSKQLRNRNVH